jgi:hypothetical protein
MKAAIVDRYGTSEVLKIAEVDNFRLSPIEY